MGNLNKAILIGRLTADPELVYTQKGTAKCKLRIAVNRTYKDAEGEKQEESDFFNVTVWAGLAETVAKYMSKGREVYIEGRIRNFTIKDDDGNDKYFTEIVANEIQFLGGGKPGASSAHDALLGYDGPVPF